MSRKIILIKQELLLLVYELNRSGLLAENEKIRPILAQRSEERFSRNAETDLVCRLLLEKKNHEARDHGCSRHDDLRRRDVDLHISQHSGASDDIYVHRYY